MYSWKRQDTPTIPGKAMHRLHLDEEIVAKPVLLIMYCSMSIEVHPQILAGFPGLSDSQFMEEVSALHRHFVLPFPSTKVAAPILPSISSFINLSLAGEGIPDWPASYSHGWSRGAPA